MISTYSSETTKKLAFRLILENIDCRKRCLYLQEIIGLGKENDVWQQALVILLDTHIKRKSLKTLSKN